MTRFTSLGLRCLSLTTWLLVATPILAAAPSAGALETGPTSPSLKWGDPAPALKVSRWVKGAPIPALKAGEIYVVEFWATWCGPCKVAIPHLTELAKKYEGRVTFIGVDVRETGSSEAAIDQKVDAFVQKMGAKMEYRVCRDLPEAYMLKAWMEATGTQGIPHSFIVDRAGRIAWIGFPGDLEKPLEQLLAGTYDIKATEADVKAQAARTEALRASSVQESEAAQRAAKAEEKALDRVEPGIEKALRAKNWTQVLRLADRAQAAYPKLPALLQWLKIYRVQALIHLDPAKAQALLEANLASPTPEGYCEAAFSLMKSGGAGRRWDELGLSYLDKAVALNPQMGAELELLRFPFLLGTDEAKAKAIFEGAKAKDDARELAEFASALLGRENLSQGWLEAAVATLEPLMEDHPEVGQQLAEAYFRMGRAPQAVKAASQWLSALKADGAPRRDIQQAMQVLRRYRAALK